MGFLGLSKKVNNLLILGLFFVATGCASAPSSQTQMVHDPLEPFNRAVFSFNDTVDTYALKPIAQGYDFVTPEVVQKGVTNFFENLRYPVVVINQFLQGKFVLGAQDTGRFVVNTTLGVVGLFDVATPMGLEKHNEDFGQTLGYWGVGSGPYIVLPFLGPSNVRDTVGLVADYYSHPVNYEFMDDHEQTRYTLLGLEVVSKRAGLLETEKLLSGDKYAFMRDAYMQRRESLVRDGVMPEEDPFLDDDF